MEKQNLKKIKFYFTNYYFCLKFWCNISNGIEKWKKPKWYISESLLIREKRGLICNQYKECQILKKSSIDSKYLQIFFCLCIAT